MKQTKYYFSAKQLLWIIPLSMLIGFLCYAYVNYNADKLMSQVAFSCLEQLHNISIVGRC